MDNPQELKKAILSALAEKGDYGTILKHLSGEEKKEAETKDKERLTQLIEPLSELADLMTQNTKGVFMENFDKKLSKSTREALAALAEQVNGAIDTLEEELRKTISTTRDQITSESLQSLADAKAQLEDSLMKMAVEVVSAKADELLPELKASGKLTDEEIDDIVDQSALSVETQITRIIGEYLEEQDITVSQIADFQEEVQKLIPAVDFSNIRLQASQIDGLPEGGTSSVLVQRMIDNALEGFSGGDSLPDQTGNAGKFLTTDGTDPSWASLTGGGDMAKATYDTNDDGIVDEAAVITSQGALATLNTVGTAQIDNNAVTFDKMQDIATAHFIGRHTAGSGDPQQVSATQARSILNVEDGATADQTGAEIKTLYEAEANTNAFTDAEKTKLAGIEAGADVTDTVNVTAAGALMDSEVTNLAAVKAFDPTDYATAAQGATADTALQPADIASGTITPRTGAINFSGGTDGDVLTVQADGSLAPETPAGGGGNTYFNNEYIDQSGGTSDTYGVLAGTINGSNTTFTVSQGAYASGTLEVFQNGKLVLQGTGGGWTETTPASGTFSFVVAPETGDEITVRYQTQTLSTDTVITDATANVGSASWVVDEDNMVSDSATKVPTQQSVKAYVDANAGGGALVKPSTDHTISGNNYTSAIVAAATISTVVQSVQVDTAGKWAVTNATTEAGGNSKTLGITVATASADASIEVFMGPCILRDDSFSFTKGQTVYLSTTAGSWTATAPSTSGNVVRKVGICIDPGYVLFDPDDTYLTVA